MMRKCLSLSLGTDYRDPKIRPYIQNPANKITWVKLWVNWHTLQDGAFAPQFETRPPSSLDESWAQLNTRTSIWNLLDAQIKALNDDGKGIILQAYQAFPRFTSSPYGSTAADTNKLGDSRRPSDAGIEQHAPDDCSGNSPWGWFIAYLIARYRQFAATSPGPSSGVLGNPLGAYVTAIEPINEPNGHAMWPQKDFAGKRIMPPKIAQIMQTANAWCSLLTAGIYAPFLLGPGVADTPTNSTTLTAYDLFTQDVATILNGWHPNVYCGWSMHNYYDTADATHGHDNHVKVSLINLSTKWWDPKNIWITEGGYQIPQDPGTGALLPNRLAAFTTQRQMVVDTFNRYALNPEVLLYTQYEFIDSTNYAADRFQSALTEEPPFFIRELYLYWAGLPGTSTP